MSSTGYDHGWVRVVEHLACADRRLRRLTVGAQVSASGVFAVAALAGLPHTQGWQGLLLAAGLGASAWATWQVASRSGWAETFAVTQLVAVVLLAIAGVVGRQPGGSAAVGMAFVVLVLGSAPYLQPLQTTVLVGGCAAGQLLAMAVAGAGSVPQGWLTFSLALGLVAALAGGRQSESRLLRELVDIEVTDAVTGLPNARYLAQVAEREFARASAQRPLAALRLDVDAFHLVTDAHGPRVADDVLAALAVRLGDVLRSGDTLACIGGARFALLLPGVGEARARELAALLRDLAAERLGGLPPVTVSVGIAVVPSESAGSRSPWVESAEDLLEQAERALETAKAAGPDRVVAAG